MNKHGYQKKYKNMKDHLNFLYKERDKLLVKLNPLSKKIEQLEKAKRNCREIIKNYDVKKS